MTDAVNYFAQLGWTAEQAEGVLDRGLPQWSGDRLQQYHNFCGAREIDPSFPESRLRFLHEDLVGARYEIGNDVRNAKTAEEARQAFEPYRTQLTGQRRWADGT